MAVCPVLKETSLNVYPISIDDNRLYITASVCREDVDPILSCEELYRHIGSVLKQRNLHIVQERIFGSINIQRDILDARKKSLCSSEVYEESPVTYIEGEPVWGEGLAGIQLYAIREDETGDKIWTIFDDGIPCGRGWRYHGTTYLSLQDIHGSQHDNPSNDCREKQTHLMFDRTERLLQRQGMTFRNVVRTWIYLVDILQWYKEFNNVRNAKYEEFGLIPTKFNGLGAEEIYLPASTGIKGANRHGAAGVMDVLAVEQKADDRATICHHTGSRQRSPYRYGSAFSRSTVIHEQKRKTIYISGTASICEDGRTLGVNDPAEQIRNTIGVVDSLLKPENASLEDNCQATVFLKHASDFPEYQRVIRELGLENLPAVCMVADVCRDELLFEIDGIVTAG